MTGTPEGVQQLRTQLAALDELLETYQQAATEQARKLEDALAANQALSRQNKLILDSVGEGVYGLDLHGKITFVNPAAGRMLGWPPEELLGKPGHATLHANEDQCLVCAALREGQTRRADEGVFRRADGTGIPVEYVSAPIRDERGELAGAVVAFQDTTERQRARAELTRKTALVKLLQEVAVAANEASTVQEAMQAGLDTVCAYTRWPVGYVYLVGHASEMVPTTTWHLDPPGRFEGLRRVTEAVRMPSDAALPGRVLQSRAPAWISDITRNPDSPRASAAVDAGLRAAFAFPVLAGAEVLAVLEFFADQAMEPDASLLEVMGNVGAQLGRAFERERAQRELRIAKEAAEDASSAKSQFLANMSHELRTPLNAIIGFSEVLADQTFGPLNTRQTRHVDNILASARHLLQLINDILDLAKIEAKRLELDLAEFDVGATLGNVGNVVKALATKKKIALTIDVEPDLPPLVADEAKFKQILYNLLSNGIKYTPDGGSVRVSATRELDSHGPNPAVSLLRVAVADTGIGIKPEDHERVFGEFTQLDDSYARQQQGTGLGLALTRRLVELHRGRIWVESGGLGNGSTFTFLMPWTEARGTETPKGLEEAGAEARPAGAALPARSGAQLLVLVVEDDPYARDLLTHYLSQAGYAVAHAVDGDEAVRKARALKPHAITLDILLQRKDGWQVLDELKSSSETMDIPVIIVSITDDRQLGVALGAVEFLVKPVKREHLVEVVRKVAGAATGRAPTVLVVDDEPATVALLTDTLRAQGFTVYEALGGQPGIDLALEKRPDIIILDLLMPEVSGLDVVQRLRADPRTLGIPVVIYTAKSLSSEERQELTRYAQAIVSKSGSEDLLRELKRLTRRRDA